MPKKSKRKNPKLYKNAIERFFNTLRPSPPPSREVVSGWLGERETDESIRRTAEWEMREKIKQELVSAVYEALHHA